MSHNVRHPSFRVARLTRPNIHRVGATVPPLAATAGAQLSLQRERHRAFVATLAHELRQPLSTVLTAAATLRAVQVPAGATKAVEIIERQARHMSRLIEDVIEAARCARDTTTLRKQLVDVRELVTEVVSDAAGAVSARGHVLGIHAAAEPLWVDADPGKLRQALSNLLDNAIKFTEPGGRIRVAAGRVGRDAFVIVRDTGRGFEPQELAHIFDLFSQVRPGEGRGLGIGLSLAHEIVTLHKGRIEVRSDGPLRGSEFLITLPTIEADALRCNATAPQTD